MAIPAWRERLQPALFRGVEFKMDMNTRAGGRRIALHEFPKKDKPYAEDMGRRAKHFTIVGYVIGANYEDQRDALIDALEQEGNGTLVLPLLLDADDMMVVCDTYSVIERKQAGGMAQFEMHFIEAGQDISNFNYTDTPSAVNNAVNQAVPQQTSSTGTGTITIRPLGNSPSGDFSASSDINGLTPSDL